MITGPQFTSEKFANFEWSFEHRTSSPGHQQTNGQAEAAVKRLICKAEETGSDPYKAILAQRNVPTEGMDSSPAQRLLGRRCKTLLPTTAELLRPQSIHTEKIDKQTRAKLVRQVQYYNRGARDLATLEEGNVLRMRPFRLGQKVWNQATVIKRHDERSYEVETDTGTYRSNRVDLKKTAELQQPTAVLKQEITRPYTELTADKDNSQPTTLKVKATQSSSMTNGMQPHSLQDTEPEAAQRPKRTIKEPAYLKTM